MRFEQFLARRLSRSERGTRRVSRPAVVIAEAGVALGLAVMIVTICVSLGFKHEIRSKVVGFNSHIHVSSFDSALSYETSAIDVGDSLMTALASIPGVNHVQRYATKPAIFRTDDEFLGFVLKGVGEEYDLSFFRSYLQEGNIDSLVASPSEGAGGRILISRDMADKLGYHVGDRVDTYFIGSTLRARRFTVCGIYETGFGDFDRLFAVGALPVVQRLNEWDDDEVTGVEVSLTDYGELSQRAWEIGRYLDDWGKAHRTGYYVQTIEEQNPNLFAWLSVLDMNVWIILLLMLLVAGFTVISGLLIIILERTSFIGTLKALGSPNGSIRQTFLRVAIYIIGKGMVWGNVIGLALCAVQKLTGIVALDPKSYYLDRVPIEFNVGWIIVLNVGMMVLSVAMLIIPSQIIARINPSKSIRFE
jgi:lipoprotein-releasing system permease protein